MIRARFEGNEIILTDDMELSNSNAVENFDSAFGIIGDTTVITGLQVAQAITPDMTVLIPSGIAYDSTNNVFLVNPSQQIATITASNPSQARRDIIQIKRLESNVSPQTRQFKNPATGVIFSQVIDTETSYTIDINVKAGSPGGSAPSVDSGYMKIAEILVPAGATTIINANIYNAVAAAVGIANTGWTTDPQATYKNGSVSDMKLNIYNNQTKVDNIISGSQTLATLTVLGNTILARDSGDVRIGTATNPSVSLATLSKSNDGGLSNLLSLENRFIAAGTTVSLRLAPSNSPDIRYNYINAVNNGSNGITTIFGTWQFEQMRLLSNGNVLVGTTVDSGYKTAIVDNRNSDAILEVSNNDTGSSARVGIALTTTKASASDVLNIYSIGSNYTVTPTWASSGVISAGSAKTNGLVLRTAAGGIRFQVSGVSNDMQFTTNKNLIIGTSADPGPRLVVAETIGSLPSFSDSFVGVFQNNGTTADSASVAIVGGNAGYSLLTFADNNSSTVGALEYSHTNNYLSILTNGTLAIRVTASNHLLINGTSDLACLTVTNDGASSIFRANGVDGSVIIPISGAIIEFTRAGTNYIWSSAVAGNFALGTNGRATSPSNANLLLNADQSVTVNTALFVDTISEKTASAGISFNNVLKVDTISEKTASAGISFNNVLKVDTISEKTASAGISFNNVVKVDTISEKTAGYPITSVTAILEEAFGIFGGDYINAWSDILPGTAITSVPSSYPCYIGNGEIIYSGTSGFLYKKSVNDTSNGTAITSVNSISPCYIGNGEIIYSGTSGFLYKKSVNDTSNGTAINSVNSSYPCYIGNGEIVYKNNVDNFLYKKSVNDTSNGTAITSVPSSYPCYIGNGEIIYSGTSGFLYKKSVNDTSNGTAINSVSSSYPCYIGNGEIVYRNASDSGFLYKKSVNDTSNGTAINSVSSSYPCYIGNGEIIYSGTSGYLYKKQRITKGLLF